MTDTASPGSGEYRIGSLDFLRGLAVLGILVINIESFAYPEPWSPYKYGYQDSLDHHVRFWVYFLAQGKFFSMFTMLFGVSFCLFLERLSHQRSTFKAMDRYARRLLILFLMGVAHAYLIWDGDVLYHYAVCGLLLFPFKSLKMRGLIIVLGVLMSFVAIRAIQSTSSVARQKEAFDKAQAKPPASRSDADEKAITLWKRKTTRKEANSENVRATRHTIWESIKVNASHQKVHQGAIFYQGILFRTLIMMMLGIIFYRLGVFQDFRRMKGYWPFTIVLLLFALWINYLRYYQWTFEYFAPITDVWKGVLLTFHKEVLGLAYMLVFNGLFQLGVQQIKWKWITNMGRMALTNYLAQSIICGVLFYGYGLGWSNQFSRSELCLIIPFIWIVQIAVSSWVINQLGQGPVERLWRKLIDQV